jgi:hypothetical protein
VRAPACAWFEKQHLVSFYYPFIDFFAVSDVERDMMLLRQDMSAEEAAHQQAISAMQAQHSTTVKLMQKQLKEVCSCTWFMLF